MFEPLSDEQCQEAANAFDVYGTKQAAADALGIPRSTFNSRLKRAAERGMLSLEPVMPGFRVSRTAHTYDGDGQLIAEHIQQKPELGPEFEMPPGQIIKGISTLVNPDNRIIQQWIKTKQDLYPVDWSAIFKEAFKEYNGKAKPIKLKKEPKQNLLTLIPCNDWHINMLCWNREVGESWDIKIAERVIGDAISTVMLRSPPSGTAVVLGGGDLMHNDDNTNRTAKSGNVLDCDGRFQKGLEAAQRLKVHTIDMALLNHQKVIVRILQGNHDEYASVAIGHFLAAWYRNEPRVEVDLDASLFWWHRFGSVLLGATHGHTVKLSKMPSIMAHRRSADWGITKFRYVHGFHIHHKEKLATEGEGVICETHQAPIPMDAWHWGSGYLSGRSVQTITYHKDYGETGRAREAILDV